MEPPLDAAAPRAKECGEEREPAHDLLLSTNSDWSDQGLVQLVSDPFFWHANCLEGCIAGIAHASALVQFIVYRFAKLLHLLAVENDVTSGEPEYVRCLACCQSPHVPELRKDHIQRCLGELLVCIYVELHATHQIELQQLDPGVHQIDDGSHLGDARELVAVLPGRASGSLCGD